MSFKETYKPNAHEENSKILPKCMIYRRKKQSNVSKWKNSVFYLSFYLSISIYAPIPLKELRINKVSGKSSGNRGCYSMTL
jgi:hypothetical protein